jgi:hypothetical protein
MTLRPILVGIGILIAGFISGVVLIAIGLTLVGIVVGLSSVPLALVGWVVAGDRL